MAGAAARAGLIKSHPPNAGQDGEGLGGIVQRAAKLAAEMVVDGIGALGDGRALDEVATDGAPEVGNVWVLDEKVIWLALRQGGLVELALETADGALEIVERVREGAVHSAEVRLDTDDFIAELIMFLARGVAFVVLQVRALHLAEVNDGAHDLIRHDGGGDEAT